MNGKYFIMGMAIVLSSCSSDFDESVVTNASTAQLSISTEIVTTRGYFDTGLKNDVEFKDGNAIGVWLVENKGTYSNAVVQNRKASYNNSAWTFDDIPVLDKKKTKVFAYYPYVVEYDTIEWRTGPISIRSKYYTVPIDISSYAHGDGQQDYLWGEADSVNCDKSYADVSFKHVLPRITFNLTKGSEEINDNVYIRRAILANATKSSAICTKGYMNILTGDVHEGNSLNGIFYTNANYIFERTISVNDSIVQSVYGTLDSKTVQELNYLVLPTEFKDGEVVLRLEISRGTSANYQLYEIPIPATKWEGGKHYTYPVTLDLHENGETESADAGEKVYLGFNADDGNPLYWSSWNLGATSTTSEGGLYGWGDPTGTHKEHSYDVGSFKNDRYYTSNESSILSYYGGNSPASNISGTSYDVARQLWGGKWRTPTVAEFKRLIANCTYEWVTISGVQGGRFTSKINGNSIFLPNTGYQYGEKKTYANWNTVSGTYFRSSDYWAGDLSASDVTCACYLYFANNGGVWTGSNEKRYQQLAIRPVTE